ncbi:hypothetical protein ACFHYQ_10380 [Sphaerimonospora cavernae]|uniref:Uncharacterized protein n=1 Tax=Sphaerimonospora cavernae TaxID=1740611 RepID=A0ABV6U400_9ACTN
MDLSSLERQRLVAVTAALFTHESDVRELLHVWLHLEEATVRVHVAADWALRITRDEPGESYTMRGKQPAGAQSVMAAGPASI